MRRALVAALLAVAASGVVAAPAAPRCYGAAARDPEHPCSNPALRHRVAPRPDEAPLVPDAPCDPVGGSTELCTFGTPSDRATGTIALFGDSHASHYRATVMAVTATHHLHGISLTRPSCPFSLAAPAVPEPKRSQCVRFNHDVIAFARDHPAITTVFVSANREKYTSDPVDGYVQAWDALPPTITRIVVLRDPFYDKLGTGDCVDAALRHHRDPATACALRRASALKPDAEVLAAARPHRAGLQVDTVDFTPFFCGARRCFPVVGGVLVHKDTGHLTLAFATTLGPYLLRAFDRLTH